MGGGSFEQPLDSVTQWQETDDVSPKYIKNIDEKHSMKEISWNSDSYLSSKIIKQAIQSYLERNSKDKIIIELKGVATIQVSTDKSEVIYLLATVVYLIDNILISYNPSDLTTSIKSSFDLSALKSKLDDEIINNNCIKGKQLRLFYNNSIGVYDYNIIKPDNFNISSVIMDPVLKEDIVDNTLFNLENLDYNNGVIFSGPPGCGKTMLTATLMNEANKKGATTIMTTNHGTLNTLKELLDTFTGKCLAVFEDVETMAPDRKQNNEAISEFLQFMNGISSFKNNLVVIATTNHLDWLDDAVKNRPMRFNRKYIFKLPTDHEIDQLVELYLDKEFRIYSYMFYNKKFTGSHISEVKRTIELIKKKNELMNLTESPECIITRVMNIIGVHFGKDSSTLGF